MKIAIVNDLTLAVETLKKTVLSVAGYEIIWIARDGAEAVEKAQKNTPDLILMDLIMPNMDGVEATKQIMMSSPCPILIVTASVKGNSTKVFSALSFGALDVVKTPILNKEDSHFGGEALLSKIQSLAQITSNSIFTIKSGIKEKKPKIFNESKNSIIVIGASTGGPKALAKILSELPSDLRTPVIIVQHVDEAFTKGLADWLKLQTTLDVVLAEAGKSPKPGCVHIAGKNDHLELRANHTFAYVKEPVDYPYKPSIDVLFNSVVNNWHGKIVGVLLTGMGRDGAEGLLNIKKAGMKTIAQDESTCVVYGMPKAAAEISAATKILKLHEIPEQIINFL